MMKVLIIEDEKPAARQLTKLLDEIGNIEVVNITDSIKSSVKWLKNNEQPELIFMDIHIADGTAFKIFENISITCPVIFTTAYDEYALEAFKVNSIDYLLKPISKDAVEKALKKLNQLTGLKHSAPDIQQLLLSLSKENSYKTHFLVHIKGNKMIPLLAVEVAYFFIEEGRVSARTFKNENFNLDFTLDDLAGKLNPNDFFRANRQFIISRNSIKDVDFWFNSRLSINLKVPVPEKILISRTRVTEFKEWFAGV
jgi:two-component system LytT family response regulator